MELHVLFGARDEEGASLREDVEASEVHLTAVAGESGRMISWSFRGMKSLTLSLIVLSAKEQKKPTGK